MITLVSHDVGAPATSGISTVGADLIVLALSGTGSNNPPTDNNSLTWNPLTSQVGGFSSTLQFWWANGVGIGRSGHIFTDNDTTPAIAMEAFSGSKVPSPFDQENGVSNPGGGSGPEQPGPVTPTENDEVIVTASGTVQFGPYSIDSGFTVTDGIDVTGGVNFSVAMGYKIQTTLGTENPIWTIGASGSSNTYIIATFKKASSGLLVPSRLSLLGAGS